MARFKKLEREPLLMMPLPLRAQLEEGTLEYAIDEILEEPVELSGWEGRYGNDQTGRLCYRPKALLKVVLLSNSRGLLSCRRIEGACRENMVFMALSGGLQPEHSTIADFVSNLGEHMDEIFSQVLMYCHEYDLREAMIKKIDSPEGQALYSRRMGIVEPVFGNIEYCKGMNRFTLRGREKVSVQGTLFCRVHNIDKLRGSPSKTLSRFSLFFPKISRLPIDNLAV